MAKLRFLHLSDWHQGRPNFDRKVVCDALVKDLADKGPVDFVIFSGDLVWSGKRDQFEAARVHFLEPVLKALGLTPDRLFLVPGNHDLDRDELGMVPAELTVPLANEQAVQKWQTDERRLERALEPLTTFEDFAKRYTGQARPSYASTRVITVGDATVTLVGLNTAWMCGRHHDANGQNDDFRQLVIGEPQVVQAYEQATASDLHITVMHHSFDWLAEFDKHRVEGRIRGWSDLVLWGHEHQPSIREEKRPEGHCIIIPAGAAFDRRVAAQPRWTNAYAVVTIDLAQRAGEVLVRQWSDSANRWNDHQDIGKNGVFAFTLPALPNRPVAIAPRNVENRMAAADRRYRDLLLETCDIVDLANLPEQDRHLATRTLELRQLYVPLRMQVEPIATPEDLEQAIERVEQRRASTLSLAGDSIRQGGDPDAEVLASVGERLKQSRRLIILGDPGGGKTTLTRWIATAYLLRLKQDPAWSDLPDVATLPDEDWLPIVIRCRDLDEKARAGTLSDILRHTLRQAELSEADAEDVHALLLDRIRANRALLILDGLDEIASAKGRMGFCQRIEKIATANPDLPMLATSRIVGYRELGRRLGQRFEHLTLAPFGREEKDAFVHRWCALSERPERRAQAAAELIADIHSGDRIERLTGNPMLLTTMALVKRKVGRLPHRRALLYWEAVQVMLNWRSEVDAPLNPDEALPQLSYLAFAMCAAGVQRMRQDEILTHLETMRQRYPNLYAVQAHDPATFLNLLASRTALMMESGRETYKGGHVPVWEFRHLTFQEYLAARALVDGIHPGHDRDRSLPQWVGDLAGRVGEDTKQGEQWREAIRLCLTICKNDEVDPALRAVLCVPNDADPHNRRARAILAALCLADEPNVTVECAAEVMAVFASEVREHDAGLGGLGGAWNIAFILLQSGRWRSLLESALLTEFLRRGPATRAHPGSVVAQIIRDEYRTDDSTDGVNVESLRAALNSGDDVTTAGAALVVAHIAWRSELKTRPDLMAALIACLDRQPPVAHAATWALALLSRYGQWRPTPSEAERLMNIVRDSACDLAQARWAIHLLDAAGGFDATIAPDDALVTAMRHWTMVGDGHMRLEIASALDPKYEWMRRILLDLVRDSNPHIRAAALDSLSDELEPPLDQIGEWFVAKRMAARRNLSVGNLRWMAVSLRMSLTDVRAALEEIARRYELPPWSFPDDDAPEAQSD